VVLSALAATAALVATTAASAAPRADTGADSRVTRTTVVRQEAAAASTRAAAGKPLRATPAEPTPAKPYLGWSSASLQSVRDSVVNPRGRFSWLDETHVLQQARALATKLKPYGYEYVNLDAGWWMSWSWQPRYDGYGRQTADPQRFPHGMRALADQIHRLGLKAGLYLPVGLEKPAYGDGTVPIWNAAGCTTHDLVYPDLRTTNGWDSSYRIDFSNPCAQKYVDSQARLIADWGYDFLKLDGVGPGSGRGGDNYDNAADVAAWHRAIDATGRPIHLELAWSLDPGRVADWQANADSWRIDTDVECYCRTLVTWDNSVDDRFVDAPGWTPYAGPAGFGNFDALNVGNGRMDGLTDAERRSYATLWAISASPLFTGDDLTRLDRVGLALLTNREVLAIDQQGVPARPVTPSGNDRQVWGLRNTDGSYTVALFNLGSAPATVTAYWSSFGFTGKAAVRDVWDRRSAGDHTDGISARLPAHGTRLFRVVPGTGTPLTTYEAEAAGNTLIAPAGIAGCDLCSGGRKIGNLYGGGALTVNDVQAPRAGIYQVNVAYTTGDPRGTDVSANGGPVTHVDYPLSGGWGIAATITIPIRLRAGANAITFGSGGGYSPDLDLIAVPGKESGR
jgi:hypothetical protein